MTRTTDIDQRASEWVIRADAVDFTQEMGLERENWLDLDPRHRASYLRIREAWRRAACMRNLRPLDGNVDENLLQGSDPNPPDPDSEPEMNDGWPWQFRIAAGVTVALIVCFAGFLAWNALAPSDWQTYSTSVGGYKHVKLPDGSDLQLNTNSEIQARITAGKREIKLIQGEILLKVAYDPNRPFTVKAAGTAVRAKPSPTSSASVSVRLRDPEGVDVSVTAGSVHVGSSFQLFDVTLGRMPFDDSTLAAGEAAKIRPEGVHFAKVGMDELNRKLSWTAGLLSFQGETLVEVTEEFNRYNRQQLVVADPRIATRRLGGAFQESDLGSFVAVLEKSFGIQADKQAPGLSGNATIRLHGAWKHRE